MSRIRSIHPKMFCDETFIQLSCNARLLLLALGTMSDYSNFFLWDEDYIRKNTVNIDISSGLSELLLFSLIEKSHDHGVINFLYGFTRRSPSKWEKIRKFIFNRDGFQCVYCGSYQSPLHCDHELPVSRGGNNSSENLKTSCQSCNLSKGRKLISEWTPL